MIQVKDKSYPVHMVLDRVNENTTKYLCLMGKDTVMSCDTQGHKPIQWRKWIQDRLTEWWIDLEEVISEESNVEQTQSSIIHKQKDDERKNRTI
jgi:hypothetical protein